MVSPAVSRRRLIAAVGAASVRALSRMGPGTAVAAGHEEYHWASAREEGVRELPDGVMPALTNFQRYFPDATRELSAGTNSTAAGMPDATKAVIYTTDDGLRRVTLSVDGYPSQGNALSAYQRAVQLSEAVNGFMFLSADGVGEQVFAGTVTQGSETHVGVGVLSGPLVIGATLAGYDASPENIANLLGLAQETAQTATAALGLGAK